MFMILMFHDACLHLCIYTLFFYTVYMSNYTCILADLHTLYYTRSVNWIGCARRGHTSRVFPRRFELQQHERALKRLVRYI